MIKPDLPKVIEDAIENRLLDIHTMLPCKVEAVDLVTRTVEVELQLKRPLPDENDGLVLEDLPKLDNVPIAIWQAGTKFFSMPITVGDYGRVIFSEADWGQWRELGANVSPGDIGRFTLSSGLYVPDFTTTINRFQEAGAQLANDIVLGANAGVQIRCKNTTVQVVSGGATDSTDFVAMAAKVENFITLFQTMMSTWVVAPTDGGGALKTLYDSTFAAFTNNMKSINLKADG